MSDVYRMNVGELRDEVLTLREKLAEIATDRDERQNPFREYARSIGMTKYEGRAFACLCEAAGRTVSKARMFDEMYGDDVFKVDTVGIKIVDVWVCKIRKHLKAYGSPITIHTVWGEGYTVAKADAEMLLAQTSTAEAA